MWIYGVIIIFIVGYWMFGPGNGVPVKSDWNTVAQMIEQGDVEKIQVVNRDLAEITLRRMLRTGTVRMLRTRVSVICPKRGLSLLSISGRWIRSVRIWIR